MATTRRSTIRGVAPSSRWRCSACCSSTAREDRLPVRGPAVGLFADQEIRLLRGPLFPGETYWVEREVVALSGSKRTESMWVRSTVFDADNAVVATMLLNGASMKDSYANYAGEHKALYG